MATNGIVNVELAGQSEIAGSVPLLAIAATFTADPLRYPLQYWAKALDIALDVTVAPYGQVMQQLLEPAGLLARNEAGVNVLLIRLEDWFPERLESNHTVANLAALRRAAGDFAEAMKAVRARASTPLWVFWCPPSSLLPHAYRAPLEETQALLIRRLGELGNTYHWTHGDLVRLYPVSQYEDPLSDRIGHIPYTDEYFIAMATLLARRLVAVMKPQYKVIALDCDNTLWKGICGEDGVAGVEITAAHLRLQECLVRQHDAGVLLCLCSKNNPDDVEAVFKNRLEMILRQNHLSASRVNWNTKSSNLHALAEELDLSLDSFVFLDDSPVECAEVRAHCPSVLVLQFPESPAHVAHFLDHVWAFDRVEVTKEARRRTAQYKENRGRKTALAQTLDLRQFLASLELTVQVSAMRAEHLPRVAELIQRTNQFNLTTIRRRANEIEALWNAGELRIVIVHARDRFGDYGLVGAVFFRLAPSLMDVDTFVLSCRALGRGVEHRIVNELGRLGREEGLSDVLLRYRPTPRNRPAREFLEKCFLRFQALSTRDGASGAESLFTVPVEYSEHMGYECSAENEVSVEGVPARTVTASYSGARPLWHETAFRLSHLSDIVREIQSSVPRVRRASTVYIAPRTAMEEAVAGIWASVLRIEHIGVRDDFFELGGDSLQAVRAISRTTSALGLELALHELFADPTVEAVAAKLMSATRARAPISRGSRANPVALSPEQKRIWFIDQMEGGSAAYYIQVALRLRGDLRVPALQAALDALVTRHETLRTTFVAVAGEPVQQIAPEGRFFLQLVRANTLGHVEAEAAILKEAREEVALPFALSAGPLIRGKLLELSAHERILLITVHHTIADGWSIGVLVRELAALYRAQCEGESQPLPPLPVQYADYVQWLREWQTESLQDEQLAYWKRHLHEAPELLSLPTDRPRPPVQSYRGASVEVSLEPALTAELRAFSQRFNVTLAVTLCTTWMVLLAKLSGQDDIVVGLPVANRRRMEWEGLIGFFANTVALRVRVDDNPSLPDLLHRLKQSMLGSYAHQDVPFERVVAALQPARTLSHSPVFQVMFVLQNAAAEVRLPDLTLTEQQVPPSTAQFDLLLSLQESASGISGSLNFAIDLWHRETIERWGGYFKALLTGMIRESQLSFSRLPWMSEHEKRQVLEGFNATHAPYSREKLIHELFEEQVERSPQASAVVYEDRSLTYSELNARANQLAAYLRQQGVGPDQLVGLCAERSLEMMVGLFGILKAGAAYVPLDPTYPPDRLAFMMEDAALKVLLTQERLRTRLPQTFAEIIVLDGDHPEIARQARGNLEYRAFGLRSHHLAYVIYTSGSTGQPKGALNEHHALVNRLQWMQRQYSLNDQDRVLQKTRISFDVSVWELFWPLITGARLIMAHPQGHQDPRYLSQMIESHAVTTLHFVPSMLQAFLDQHRSGQGASLRQVICSGEELPAGLQNRFFEQLSWVRLHNLYGPTEAAIDVTAWECSPDNRSTRVPIGRPISNVQIYVLDRFCQPVPTGVTGEIHIAGVAVGRGYLNRPQLSEERFVPNPFSADAQARMYRTGDLGRWRADGVLEYLGRNDQQVKLRGFRIELGEIESRLLSHPAVKEAAVIAREDSPGEKRVVAYLVARDRRDWNADSVRAHLKAALPEYMVPSAFVLLEGLPLSPNGKLDRQRLSALQEPAYVHREYEAPQDEIEEALARIWQALLRVARVGRRDNFFELGGHSLLVPQMMERLRSLGLSAEIQRVFASPTLKDLASSLIRDTAPRTEPPPNLIPPGCEAITPEMLTLVRIDPQHIEAIVRQVPGGARNIQDIYPLAPLQEGILFHHRLHHGGDVYVVPTLFSVSSRENLDAFIAALQRLTDRHDVLRTAVVWEGLPQPLQVVYRKAEIPVEFITLDPLRDAVEQLKEWMSPQRQTMDLRQAPLMRLRVAADSHSAQWYALLSFHHIAGDNTSQEIVISAVAASLEGRVLGLPEPAQYRYHVAQALAQADAHDAEAFFRKKLAEIDEPTAPFGLLDVRGDGSRIEEARESIESTLAGRVRVQARRLGVSAATLFHSAWGMVVAATSGREDVVFGSVLLGRLHGSSEARRMLGMFINTLPLRLRLRGVTARELVERTQQELIELLAHEQASLAVAQRCSGLASAAPLFTALLNCRHGTAISRTEWGGAGIRTLVSHDRTNYPVVLAVDDEEDGFALTVQTDSRIDPHRMLAYVSTALRSITKALEQSAQTPVLALSILPDAERHQVIEAYNRDWMTGQEEHAFADHHCIHELFEQQVARTPDAIAVVDAQQELTYSELNARANQLARHLRRLGVVPEDKVALCFERGVEMVVALLAVMKAGGAYVPLDPSYPRERLRHMLQDVGPRVVLTHMPITVREQPEIGTNAKAPIWVDLDADAHQWQKESRSNVDTHDVGVTAENLVYVIYTSGSTGLPKGVAIRHRNLTNLWQGLERGAYLRQARWQRVSVNASLSFDASMQQIVQLLSGRTLIIVPQKVRMDAQELLSFLDRNRVDVLDCTPTQLAPLLAAGLLNGSGYAPYGALVGGEAIDAQMWHLISESHDTKFLNVYGPTECTVDVTLACAETTDDTSHIGRPLARTRIYLLNQYGQPVPIGVPGEIHVGGAGVGRGYLNRPGLTAERFVADPYAQAAGACMYRTGDLGRHLADGRIEFLGRNDSQAKIRGYRIELGEIEAHLRHRPDIQDAAVVVREDSPNDRRLVAYYTPKTKGSGALDVQTLRAYLSERLPQYMLPGAFVQLETLPLTPNNKLDRKALPPPYGAASVTSNYEPPCGEIEGAVAQIWEQVLKLERVGRNDHFFELGGHSLLAVSVVEQMRQKGLHAEVWNLFVAPTLTAFAASAHEVAEVSL